MLQSYDPQIINFCCDDQHSLTFQSIRIYNDHKISLDYYYKIQIQIYNIENQHLKQSTQSTILQLTHPSPHQHTFKDMNTSQQPNLHTDITQFSNRFTHPKKQDDLFSRGYTLCLDTLTNRRVIQKFYSIETQEQEQAVLQNLHNFAKLNQVEGICKILAFAVAENGTELISAFEYDPMTLGEFVKIVKNEQIGIGKAMRQQIYVDVVAEIIKIIARGVQIGIELDDINRQTIIMNQNKTPTKIDSSSSIITASHSHSLYSITIFYDQRQKQYTKIQNNSLSVQANNNKLYWSPEKVQTQIIRNKQYGMQEGEQSMYQLGLMMLDVVYEIQRYYSSKEGERVNENGGSYRTRGQQELMPDQIALHAENPLSYYHIDKQNRKVQRNQMLVSHRLNYLISSADDFMKQIGILFKSMIILMAEARPDLYKVANQVKKLQDFVKQNGQQNYNYSPLHQEQGHGQGQSQNQNQQTPRRNFQKNAESMRSLQSIPEQQVHLSISQTLQNIPSSKFPPQAPFPSSSQTSSNQFDSLKYSQNSLGFHSQFTSHPPQSPSSSPHDQPSSLPQRPSINLNNNPNANNNNNSNPNSKSPSPIPYPKQANIPSSTTTITSQANTSNKLTSGSGGFESGRATHNNGNTNGQQPILMQGQNNHQINQSHRNNMPNGPQLNNNNNSDWFINVEMLVNCSKGHHETLRNLLMDKVNELIDIRKSNPNLIYKKQYVDKSIYYGCIDQQSRREGPGIFIYKTGDVYFGNWKNNALNQGVYLFKNSQSFQGSVIKGGKQGLGIYRYSNGNVYNGSWQDDLKHGHGVMIYPSGARYQGDWLKGKKHGNGLYQYEHSGLQYRGGFALGKKYGNGVLLYGNGTKVQGFWSGNCVEGLTKIYYQNGDYYEGNLHMSQKMGEGIYKWKDEGRDGDGQVQYKGQFKKDNLDGFAVIKFSNGECYEGKVKNGRRDGQGTYKYSNGDEFKGQWKNDQKQMGKYIFSTGDQFEGKFKSGQMAFGTMKYPNGQVYQGQFYRGERHGIGTYSNKVGHIVYEGRWQKDQYVDQRHN